MVFADKLQVVQVRKGWFEMDVSDERTASIPFPKLHVNNITFLNEKPENKIWIF
jgi:hypothetical protein